MSKNFVSAMPMAMLDAATLVGGIYTPINADVLTGNLRQTLISPCVILRIINDSNVEVIISFDGVTPHDLVGAGNTITLPFQSGSSPTNWKACLPNNLMIYAMAAGAGIGTILVGGYYQEN